LVALKEEDPAKREAMFAAVELRLQSEQARRAGRDTHRDRGRGGRTMSPIARRVSRLEDTTGVREPRHPRHVVQIIVEPEEDEGDVIARYRTDHPETPEDVFLIVRKIVVPQHREVGP